MRDPFLRSVGSTIERRRLLRRRDSVLVAVSGGPDSVALVTALAALGEGRWRIGVAHVNHRLRGADSERDARFVVALARRLDLSVHVLDGRIEAGGNLEERAREVRYRLLRETAAAAGYRRIATGHTRDDQAETLLLRVLRGAGPRGLSAIAPERADGVIRPLLDTPRADAIAFLARRGLRFRRDRSNRDPRFTRNRVRARLLPMLEREFNPEIRTALARTAAILAEEDAILATTAARRLARAVDGDRLDAARVRRAPLAIARRMVRLWLAAAGGPDRLDADHVEGVLRLAHATARGRVSIAGGEVVRSGGGLRWLPRARAAASGLTPVSLAIPGEVRFGAWMLRARVRDRRAAGRASATRAIFDAEAIGTSLAVRAVRAGDRIRPLGLGGTKKLQDVFVDAKVGRDGRATHPVVLRNRTIVWVPGLVRSEIALVAHGTHRVVVVECSTGG